MTALRQSVVRLPRAGSMGARLRVSVLVVLLLLLAAAPEYLSASTVRILLVSTVLGLVAMGLNLSFGYGGQLALGHVFFYAAAAYTTAILLTRGVESIFVLAIAGIAVALVAAVITGVPGLRLSSWSLALTSIFPVVLLPDLVNLRPDLTNGFDGIVGIPRPTVFGATPLDNIGVYHLAIAVLAMWLVVQRNLLFSGYGRMLATLRESEIVAGSLGVSVYRLKLMAYVLSAIPAGMAGVLFASMDGFVTYQSFSFDTLVLVLAGVIVGGERTLYGPIIGITVLVAFQQQLAFLEGYTLLAFGTVLVIGAVGFRRGIVGTFARKVPLRPTYLRSSSDERAPGDAVLRPVERRDLEVRGASKSFDGNQALSDVDFTALSGQVTALIGPNGSGKTTLLNAISGFLHVDHGQISLGGVEIATFTADRVAGQDVGRTFQTPNLPEGLTVREAVAAAAFRSRRTGLVSTILRLPRWRREEHALAARVDYVLGYLDIDTAEASTPVTQLPLGRKRLVEIARAVLMSPALVLLDEPASGLTVTETRSLRQLLRELAAMGTTVLLVEHNMDLVLGVADAVCVLSTGQVIARGSADEIARDPRVIEAYLGADFDTADVTS